jgi:ABC-type molybdenum transport system ATPase subunit/photorepair protein PhrA
LFFGCDFWGTYKRKQARDKVLHSALDKGTVPAPVIEKGHVERKEVSKEIESILCPPEDYDSYNLIVGSEGTGKSTLVRLVGHEHSGIIYVQTYADWISRFTDDFAEALRWSPPEVSLTEHFLREAFNKNGKTTTDIVLMTVLKDKISI